MREYINQCIMDYIVTTLLHDSSVAAIDQPRCRHKVVFSSTFRLFVILAAAPVLLVAEHIKGCCSTATSSRYTQHDDYFLERKKECVHDRGNGVLAPSTNGSGRTREGVTLVRADTNPAQIWAENELWHIIKKKRDTPSFVLLC